MRRMSDGSDATPDPSPPDPDNLALAANIQAAARAKNATNRAIAEHLGVHETTVGRIMTGDIAISYERMAKIARFLDLEPDQLVTGNLEESTAQTAARAALCSSHGKAQS